MKCKFSRDCDEYEDQNELCNEEEAAAWYCPNHDAIEKEQEEHI